MIEEEREITEARMLQEKAKAKLYFNRRVITKKFCTFK